MELISLSPRVGAGPGKSFSISLTHFAAFSLVLPGVSVLAAALSLGSSLPPPSLPSLPPASDSLLLQTFFVVTVVVVVVFDS